MEQESTNPFSTKRNDYQTWLFDNCITTRFDVNENWIIKLEGHSMDGANILFDMDNLDDQGNIDLEEDWFMYAVKITYSF